MAAQIPIKNDSTANDAALAKVREDKRREANDGHDGTWVAHPGLVPIAAEQFAQFSGDNQIRRARRDVKPVAEDLLVVPQPPSISEQGVRTNCSVGIQYLESWLRGQGCVPINNLMEDAATAEISRAQLWQWVKHRAAMVDGRIVTRELVEQIMDSELSTLRVSLGDDRFTAGKFEQARDLFTRMIASPGCPDFLTSIAYELL
jgi:malate synthase